MKTSIVNLKNEKGEEYKTVFGDLVEILQYIESGIDNSEKFNDLADLIFQLRSFLKQTIADSIEQSKKEKNNPEKQ